MKKLLIVVLALLMAGSAYAFDIGGIEIGGKKMKVFESINNSGTQITRNVPTTLMTTGTKIVGIVITKAADGGTGAVGLWDVVGNNAPWTTLAECVAEAEYTNEHNGVQWFPYALSVVTSVTIKQGENTIVFIYYE